MNKMLANVLYALHQNMTFTAPIFIKVKITQQLLVNFIPNFTQIDQEIYIEMG
jgi:hypothetical protein